MAVNVRWPVVVKTDLRHRFYHAVVFLSAVKGACEINRQRVPPDLSWHQNNSFDTTFRDFVNSLCQFCDVNFGGDSVTSTTVLDLQDRIQYRFACNKRNKTQLTSASNFIKDLLGTLQDVTVPDAELRPRLLSKVLGFCRSKVRTYLRYLKKASRACMRTGPAEAILMDQLRGLEKATKHADFAALEVSACEF